MNDFACIVGSTLLKLIFISILERNPHHNYIYTVLPKYCSDHHFMPLKVLILDHHFMPLKVLILISNIT